mmetsp:Transcript_35393/g.114597  ORF Transcript_35393/g.114597 Transcript_35393/m.114597 type:complete len:360 (-) Transcript_35393:134-1213(-)
MSVVRRPSGATKRPAAAGGDKDEDGDGEAPKKKPAAANNIKDILEKWVPRGRVVTFEELSFLRGGLGGMGSVSISKLLNEVTDDEVPWWRVVRAGALTGPVNEFLQQRRPETQAERLMAEGVNLDQPLKAREEVRRYSDVRSDVPFHPLSHLVQTQVLHPIGPHKRTLIWLHGRDNTALRCRLMSPWKEQCNMGTKILLPNSPLQREMDKVRFCWFRSEDPDIGEVEDVARDIMDLIRVEGSGIGPQNVCVGGYSQGAMLAIHLAVTLGTKNMGGAIALNGWKLPCTTASTASTAKQPKLMTFNGDADAVVDPIRARASFAGLKVVHICHPTKGVEHAIKPNVEKQVIDQAMAELCPNA